MMTARRVLRFEAETATDRDGDVMTCECGKPLAVYRLELGGAVPKTVLCCSGTRCGNGAKATAKIHRATIEGEVKP